MKNLILLHGALGAAKQLHQLKSQLAKHYNIYDFDLKSHGHRAEGLPFTMATLTDDVLNMMNENGIENACFFGYSMGGYIALSLAVLHPSKITGVFTLGTKLSWTDATVERETGMLNPDLMLEKVPAFAESLKALHGTSWSSLVRNTADMMRNLALLPLTEKDFKSIHHPVRLAMGDKDNMVTLEETISVYKLLPKGSLLVIPDTRHPIDKVSTERLADEIKIFFE